MFGFGLAAFFKIDRTLLCGSHDFRLWNVNRTVCFNTLVQSIIEDDKRGRVMSLYTVGSIGIGPLGSLTAGALADIFGGTFSGLVFGFGAISLALWMKMPN